MQCPINATLRHCTPKPLLNAHELTSKQLNYEFWEMTTVATPQSELATILEKIKNHPIFDGIRYETLLTREEWGDVIGIHRNTIPRWEQQIISKVAPINNSYFTVNRMRSPYLDPYQRFILAVIYVAKGGFDHKNKPHKPAIDFLKLNFLDLKREKFEEWRKANV